MGLPLDTGKSDKVAVNGRRLKELRDERHWKQATLAEKADCCPRTIWSMENEEENHDRRIVAEIARVLGVPPVEIEAQPVAPDNVPLSEDGPGEGAKKSATGDTRHDIKTVPKEEIEKARNGDQDEEPRISVEVKLDTDFNSFTAEEQQKIVDGLKAFLSAGADMQVKGKRRGSVILTLEMSPADFKLLRQAYLRGDLAGHKVKGIRRVDENEAAPERGSPSGEMQTAQACPGVRPHESEAVVATGAWPDCAKLRARIRSTDLPPVCPTEEFLKAGLAPNGRTDTTQPCAAPLSQPPGTAPARSPWSWLGVGLAIVAFLCFVFFLVMNLGSTDRGSDGIVYSRASDQFTNVALNTEAGGQAVPKGAIRDQRTGSERPGLEIALWMGVAVVLLWLQIRLSLNRNWFFYWLVLFCWVPLTILIG
jgi:transcriptional regulator with XRE-family HTH domain